MEESEIFARNLKSLMQQLHVTNAQLAKALRVDPSLVSHWLKDGCGSRNASSYAIAIGKYVEGKYLSPENSAWLNASLVATALPQEAPLCARLAIWLYPSAEVSPLFDGARGFSSMLVVEGFRAAVWPEQAVTPAGRTADELAFSVSAGVDELAALLERELSGSAKGAVIDIYLSSETMYTAVRPQVLSLFRAVAEGRRLRFRVLVQSSNNSMASSRLISAYMPLLVGGALELAVAQSMPQTFTTTMDVLCSEAVVSVSESAQGYEGGGKAPVPVVTVIRDEGILRERRENFQRSLRFARPMMNVYDDSFARAIIDVFFEEYGVPGSLDVIKCGLNPMYMTVEQYGKVLRDSGQTGEQYGWRYQEFARFKAAMDGVLRDSRFRELLSLTKLREIAETGRCKMPAMYFMDAGVRYMDARDCVNILDGYIRYLKRVENFQVLLLEDEEIFMPNSCWHIKNSRHVMIHSWDTDAPIMIYSDQMLLIDEFQRHFEHMWNMAGQGGPSKRAAIETLGEIRERCAKRITE